MRLHRQTIKPGATSSALTLVQIWVILRVRQSFEARTKSSKQVGLVLVFGFEVRFLPRNGYSIKTGIQTRISLANLAALGYIDFVTALGCLSLEQKADEFLPAAPWQDSGSFLPLLKSKD